MIPAIIIDLNPVYEFLDLPVNVMAERILYTFGWIPIGVAFLWGAKEVWLSYIRRRWGATLKFIMLAIDIPRGNTQGPKAVENIFTYLAGAQGSVDLIEKYWEGKFQLSFSLEIVSIEGYTQFLIRTPVQYRDLVESAIYSQYPDAEITEVNDYTEGAPTRFPDEEYDIWGGEFIQVKNSAYPIKTYEEFEHQFGEPEEQFKDPMASLMDLCSSLKKGEQLWYQIILIPIGFDWVDIGDKEISKILGEKTPNDGIIDKVVDAPLKLIGFLTDIIFSAATEKKEEKKEETLKMINLKPKEKKQIEAIQEKVSKIGFEFKMRLVYVAKKDVMNKPKVLNGFVGYMKQFAVLDLNNLKPDTARTATKVSYFFSESRMAARKNRIMRNYITREDWAGRRPGILNIEELATIWHFPVEAVVKAPLIQKAPGRKAEPPMSLPALEEGPGEDFFKAQMGGGGEKDDIFAGPPHPPAPRRRMPPPSASQEEAGAGRSIFDETFIPETGEEGLRAETVKKGAPPDNLPIG